MFCICVHIASLLLGMNDPYLLALHPISIISISILIGVCSTSMPHLSNRWISCITLSAFLNARYCATRLDRSSCHPSNNMFLILVWCRAPIHRRTCHQQPGDRFHVRANIMQRDQCEQARKKKIIKENICSHACLPNCQSPSYTSPLAPVQHPFPWNAPFSNSPAHC